MVWYPEFVTDRCVLERFYYFISNCDSFANVYLHTIKEFVLTLISALFLLSVEPTIFLRKLSLSES